MALDPRSQYTTQTVSRAGAGIDEGLRSYMLRVYNYMAGGLVLTGVVAYATSQSPALLELIYGNTLVFWVVMLAPLGLILFGFRASVSAGTAQVIYWLFSGLMGLSLSYVFLAYTGASVTRVFFITAGTFTAMSLYGYTTKRDLTGIGSFLIMGLIGLIIASVVNIFMQSAAMEWVISVIGVLIFVGLTAYDTQKIKNDYNETDDRELMTKKAVFGALRLYLDFINLFLFLLRLFGNRN